MATNSELEEYRRKVEEYHAKRRAEDLKVIEEDEARLNTQLSLDHGLALLGDELEGEANDNENKKS